MRVSILSAVLGYLDVLFVILLSAGLHTDCIRATGTSDGAEAPGVLQVGAAVLQHKVTRVTPGNISTGCPCTTCHLSR